MTEDWAEIRRLHKSEQMSIKAIGGRTGLARNTVRAALSADEPEVSAAFGGFDIDSSFHHPEVLAARTRSGHPISAFAAQVATQRACRRPWGASPSVRRIRPVL